MREQRTSGEFDCFVAFLVVNAPLHRRSEQSRHISYSKSMVLQTIALIGLLTYVLLNRYNTSFTGRESRDTYPNWPSTLKVSAVFLSVLPV